jgi:hypothetical protein
METMEEKELFDAEIEARAEALDNRTLYLSNVAYAMDIEQDLVIEIPLADDSVARATLTPADAELLLRQICKVMQIEVPKVPFSESDIPW